jgi:hypothetical protein
VKPASVVLLGSVVLVALILGATSLTPGLISFTWNFIILVLPYAVITISAFAVFLALSLKSETLAGIVSVVIFIGGIGGYFLIGEHLGEYDFAKNNS